MEELNELVSYLLGAIKDEDLDNPDFLEGLSHLVDLLDKKKIELPDEMREALLQIPNKKDRFRQAAQHLGVDKNEDLATLAQAMKKEGLLKSEKIEIEVLSGILGKKGGS